MKINWNVFMVLGLAAAMALPAALAAESRSERKLSEEGEKIEATMRENPGNHTGALADQFGVPKETVEGLRETSGWGEATIQLSLAEKLAAENPDTYPNGTADALPVIRDMRSDGKGYGEISKELGFKLGHVIRDTKRAHKDISSRVKKTSGASAPPYGPPGIMKKGQGHPPAGAPGQMKKSASPPKPGKGRP